MTKLLFDLSKKDKKIFQILVKLNCADKYALKIGMAQVGETNKSSYIRRLIHENKRQKQA